MLIILSKENQINYLFKTAMSFCKLIEFKILNNSNLLIDGSILKISSKKLINDEMKNLLD